jgi:sec-independent protein translocase protein TatA
MFGLGGWEIAIILFVILLIFGVGRLPELGGGIGKAITNFKKAIKDQDSGGKTDSEKDKIEEK